MDFILGLGLALPIATSTGVSVVTGVAEGVSHQQKLNAESNARQLKFHLRVKRAADSGPDSSSTSTSSRAKSTSFDELHNGIVVLAHDRLWILPQPVSSRNPSSTSTDAFQDEANDAGFYEPERPHMAGQHAFTGFFFAYPDDERPATRGLVSTISRDPPALNWIYVDTDTGQVRYSNRTGSRPHVVGDYDWTAETGPQSRISLQDWEGFVAVREPDGEGGLRWALYFDLEDDGLKSRNMAGKKVVEVCLFRRVIGDQEVNKWGLQGVGNMGVKKDIQVRPGDNAEEKGNDGEQS